MSGQLAPLTEAEVLDRLRARYRGKGATSGTPEWCFLTHVGNTTGQVRRYADALAFNYWASRGHALHGFEVKVSRNDWLREMKDPSKAEVIARFCERWYLVVGHDGIVEPGELPDGWGLMVCQKSRLIEAVKPTLRTPDTLPRGFIAQLLRNATTQAPGLQDTATAVKRAEEAVRKYEQGRYEALQADLARVEEALATFRKMAGFNPLGRDTPYSVRRAEKDAKIIAQALGWAEPERIGSAVAAIVERSQIDEGLISELRSFRNRTSTALRTLDEVLDHLDPQETP